MKASSVSSAGIANATRYTQMRMQVDLVREQKERDTGRVADLGLALGTRTAQSVTFARDLGRLNAIIDSNSLVASRLTATQDALGQLNDQAQTLLSSLMATSGTSGASVTAESGKAALQAMTSILNTSVNGEFLFAGTNTDVRPIDDFNAPGSPAKAAFDASFQAYFGFAQNDPAAAGITAAAMDGFLATEIEPQFLGAGWQANWSNATDQPIVSRIALNETAETSVSANADGMRKLAMAASIVSQLMSEDSKLGGDAKQAVASRATALAGEAMSDLSQTMSQAGIVQKRTSDANTRMNTQIDLFDRHITDLEGVDPYEAANRVSSLVSQIETSFALTARIQQLSLLNFLTP